MLGKLEKNYYFYSDIVTRKGFRGRTYGNWVYNSAQSCYFTTLVVGLKVGSEVV